MEETIINNPQLPPNPTKFYTHFLYKAIFVSIFILLLPLFPSQAPEFINNKTINTTSWEFLQLVFVGIAVSYGLFSKRNDESPKEEGPFKPDNTQSYVARLLQVSSVFDDDTDHMPVPAPNDKVQTWNSQYYRGEPIVVVAKESDDTSSIEKPLLLPVRSLKTSVSDSEPNSNPNTFNRSNSRRITRNLSRLSTEETEENIVLRSPIPWRSRSGRLEVKEAKEDFSQTPGVHDSSKTNSSETNPIESPSFRYQYAKLSKAGLNPSPEHKTHHSSPTSSSEFQSTDDISRRKTMTKSTTFGTFSQIPPPPPPPPPPPHRPETMNSHLEKQVNRNSRSIPEEPQNRGRSRTSKFTARSQSDTSYRARKESEFDEYLSHDREIERFIERKGSQRKMKMDEETEEYHKTEEKDTEESECEEEEEKGNFVKDEEEIVGSDNGPDVDKKADEFIAKFREQIRLQRIASIRKSTAQNGHR